MRIKTIFNFFSVWGIVIAALGSTIAFSEKITEWKVNFLGENTSDLKIISSKLEPMYGFFEPLTPDFNELAFIKLKIRNFGDEEYILTSADIEVINTKGVRVSPASRGGLGENPVDNDAIKIAPGEEVEIPLSQGIKLKGITPFFKSEDFKNQVFIKMGQTYSLVDLRWVSKLNHNFSSMYGEDAVVKVSLYEKYKKPIKVFELRLSAGTDRFKDIGEFQHDFFIGDVRLRLDEPPKIMAN